MHETMRWEVRTWRHLACSCHVPPGTRDDLARVEEILGTSLPTDVAEFLCAFNGGWLEYDFRWRDGLAVTFPQVVDLDPEWLGERLRRRGSRRQLQIASGASPLVLDLDESPPPLRFLPARCHPELFPDEQRWEILAPTFEEYVNGLTLCLDDHFDGLTHLLAAGHAGDAERVREFLDVAAPGWRRAWEDYCAMRGPARPEPG